MSDRFSLPANTGTLSSVSRTLMEPTSSLGFTSIPFSIPTSTSKSAASHSQAGKSAGLGVAIGFGVVAVGVIVFCFVIRRQNHRRAREKQHQRPAGRKHNMAYESSNPESNETHEIELDSKLVFATPEIDGTSRHEIDGVSRHEIDGASSHGRQKNDFRR